MVDARGHGKSEAPDGGYDQATMAEDLAGVITGLDLEKPVVLGHSMGAATALHLAGLFPELPGAILLEDPPAFWQAPEHSPEDEDHMTGFVASIVANKRKTRNELMAECQVENPGWSEAELKPWVDSKHRFSLKITQMFDIPRESPEETAACYRQIICPVVLITGDQEKGAIVGEAEVASLKALVPHLQHKHIPDAGHSIRRDQFSTYMQVLENTLADLTEN
jgi:pimeloyl-ACP methyl ester carboxylesterase